MYPLITLFVAMATAIANANASPLNHSNETALTCRDGSIPLFTNETFCTTTSQKIFTCCHHNNFEIENPLKTELKIMLDVKFKINLGESLEAGNNSLSRCLQNSLTATQKNLVSTTQGAVKTLALFPWKQILDISSTSFECRKKIGQAFACGNTHCLPSPLPGLQTCSNFCLNIIHGCFHRASEQLLLPWKHSINSIITAIRLSNTLGICEEEKANFETFVSNLDLWREPFAVLDGICVRDKGDCFHGDFGPEGLPLPSRNSKNSVPWSTDPLQYSNPEFSIVPETGETDGKLELLKTELEAIEKTLTTFWPSTSPTEIESLSDLHLDTHDEKMEEDDTYDEDEDESDDEIDLDENTAADDIGDKDTLKDDTHGDDKDDLGDDAFDEDDDEYSSGSGYYGNFPTDDEDLLAEDAGSGDDGVNDISVVSVPAEDTNNVTGEGNKGGRQSFSFFLIFVCLGLVIF